MVIVFELYIRFINGVLVFFVYLLCISIVFVICFLSGVLLVFCWYVCWCRFVFVKFMFKIILLWCSFVYIEILGFFCFIDGCGKFCFINEFIMVFLIWIVLNWVFFMVKFVLINCIDKVWCEFICIC